MIDKNVSVALLAVSVTLAVGLGRATLSAGPVPSKSPDLAAQISRDIDRALKKNSEARTQREWQNSGYTPEDIFRNVKDLKFPEGKQVLCRRLLSLVPQDIALFEDEIQDPSNQEILPCQKELQGILEDYWSQSRVRLAMHHDPDLGKQNGFHHDSFLRIFDGTLPELPSIEKELDASTGPILERGNLANGEVTLTFDDGPHPTRSKRILEILNKAKIQANYFQIGRNAATYPQISQEIQHSGRVDEQGQLHSHVVGSHTWSHPNLPKLSLKKAEEEILKGRDHVAQAAGVDNPFFRFPYGAKTPALKTLVREKQMAMFFWNMDSLDWKIRDPEVLLKNVLVELNREKGGILLFHDLHEQTVIALPHVIEELSKRGFKTVVFVPKK